jgi:tetratricopeptide (TPR) repeat protein
MAELSDDIHSRITALSKEGDDLAESGQYEGAISRYALAWALLPEPKSQWEAALWLQAAIGDAYYYDGRYEEAERAFAEAQKCANGYANPFVQLRRGECLFELGDLQAAHQWLAGAYMLEGRQIFEDEHPKYLASLSTVMKPPVGQDSL